MQMADGPELPPVQRQPLGLIGLWPGNSFAGFAKGVTRNVPDPMAAMASMAMSKREHLVHPACSRQRLCRIDVRLSLYIYTLRLLFVQTCIRPSKNFIRSSRVLALRRPAVKPKRLSIAKKLAQIVHLQAYGVIECQPSMDLRE